MVDVATGDRRTLAATERAAAEATHDEAICSWGVRSANCAVVPTQRSSESGCRTADDGEPLLQQCVSAGRDRRRFGRVGPGRDGILFKHAEPAVDDVTECTGADCLGGEGSQ